MKKVQANLDRVRVKADQFRLVFANKYTALEQKDEDDIQLTNETVTKLLSEATIAVAGKTPRQPLISEATIAVARKALRKPLPK